jgi:hypothetical protein
VNLLPQPREVALGGPAVEVTEPVEHVGAGGLAPEGYQLTIATDGAVRIDAADPAGAAHARRTLTQLRRLHGGRAPAGTVRDRPDLPVRGVMLDVSRDKVPTMATLRALVDRLAEWKVNHLELYAEHTFAYRDHEVVWRDASPFTPAEIRELDRYCAERHVELVPNQNCLGHMGRWLRHAPYRDLAMAPDGYTQPGIRRGPTTIEPGDPRALALVRGLLTELLPCFSAHRFVHVGLDEPWEMPPERLDDYLAWVRQLRALPELTGRELLMWGDVLGGDPAPLRALPDGVTVCEWGYDAGHPFAARAAAYAAAARPFWTAPGTSSWLSILGRVTNLRANCAEAMEAALAHGGGGVLVTDWGDQGHLQYLPIAEPGLAYGAAVAWGLDANRDLDLGAALSAHCYDDPTGGLADALLRLGDAHRVLTPQLPNIATLVMHLYWPQITVGRGPLAGTRGDEYAAVQEQLAAATAAIDRSASARADGALVADELRNAIALVSILCDDARARLAGDGTLASIPAPHRRDLVTALEPVITEHERLWLARNRPGGLPDSRAWLEHLRACYETGTAERSWGGPES